MKARNTCSVLAILTSALIASAAENDFTPLPNPEFAEGTDAPAGWKLSGGQGRWVDRQVLEVAGDGKGSNCWQCEYRFEPEALYRFQFRGRATAGSGCVISGPGFANHDWQLTPEWKWYGYVFRTPDNAAAEPIRLGQWEAKGTFQFDAVRLCRVVPVFVQRTTIEFPCDGECVRDGQYRFTGTFGGERGNYHPILTSATAAFNTDRWCFDGRSQVTYHFKTLVPPFKYHSGTISVNVNHLTRGGCLVEASTDGTNWRPLLTQKKAGSAKAAIPTDLCPTQNILLRLKAATADSSFQVNRIDFAADFGLAADVIPHLPEIAGCRTLFADVRSAHPRIDVPRITVVEDPIHAPLQVSAKPNAKELEDVKVVASVRRLVLGAESPTEPATDEYQMEYNKERQVYQGYPALPALDRPGEHEISLALQTKDGKAWKVDFVYSLHDYYRADYGAMIGKEGEQAAVWWCDATHKVAPQRALPEAESAAAELSAAKNDREAVQIVVRPQKSLKGLTATAAAMTGPNGAPIPAQNIQILRVAYHFVEHPTDATGVADWWPDALPPLKKPLDLPADKNQPFWVLVYVPKDANPGDYVGKITLKAEGWSQEVPIRLHVWNFTLPEKNHIDTALGLSPHEIWRYHQLKTEADRRRVFDMYLQSFAEHRISPYDPAPLDPIGVRFLTEADPPRAELDFTRFDAAMARAVEKFRLTNFQVHLQGMGGGTFHSRVDPSIGKYGENTPQYQAAMKSYLGQLESHLREKGWLKMAYTYWFDEPDPKDYEFVRRGMERLKKHAPGLATMLTEEPGDALAGPIDIWCPVSFNYNRTEAEKRRAAGERLWWYVCCGPKAPHCTLFIDHPAVELRTWLWQSWQRNITGILIWSTNYWTSPSAFPDKPQNPYEDPMGYVSGYSTPRGSKQFWGNGDGRFLYPPEAAAVPGHSGSEPVIEPPVSSIRWEMLREGIEDYEYLCLLRELLAKRRGSLPAEQVKAYEELLTVPESITRDMTTFSTDPAPIYARRKAIAEAIERLQR